MAALIVRALAGCIDPAAHHLQTIPDELAQRGYNDQLCLDFSPVVVETMSKRHASIAGIEWQEGDVRKMDSVPSESIDVAFDKGTLDAMIHGSPWSPPEDVLENTGQYIREVAISPLMPETGLSADTCVQVFRVLKPDGMFVYITYRQPHFVKPLLDCEGTKWDIKVDVLGGAGSFGYHGFTLTKAAAS